MSRAPGQGPMRHINSTHVTCARPCLPAVKLKLLTFFSARRPLDHAVWCCRAACTPSRMALHVLARDHMLELELRGASR